MPPWYPVLAHELRCSFLDVTKHAYFLTTFAFVTVRELPVLGEDPAKRAVGVADGAPLFEGGAR